MDRITTFEFVKFLDSDLIAYSFVHPHPNDMDHRKRPKIFVDWNLWRD
ncbi:MAG: hypothetical protein IPN97_08210 [Saprospiraceae bacterium]|nr:hypothetical protein [Saprospiraceae bacterium]